MAEKAHVAPLVAGENCRSEPVALDTGCYLKQHLPLFDRGISALIEDIGARGLDRDVTICVSTEKAFVTFRTLGFRFPGVFCAAGKVDTPSTR